MTGKLKCELCSKEFTNKNKLNVHIKGVHEKSEEHKCICGKIFYRKSDFNLHKSTVHDGIKKFKCEPCKKSYTQSSALRTHISSVHEKLEPQLHFTSKKILSKRQFGKTCGSDT